MAATEEWGDTYTMVMVESSPQMREVHDRMPVIFARITGKHGSKARHGSLWALPDLGGGTGR
jgi:hypothetical protein